MKKMFVDHHIQKTLLVKLSEDGPSNFASIQPEGVENSLFMYHLRKLIGRNMVEKVVGSYALTEEGAQWVNKVGHNMSLEEYPRLLIQFLVVDRQNMVLVSERVEKLAQHLNRYMFPGGVHEFGLSTRDATEDLAGRFGLTVTDFNPIVRQETIIAEKKHHSISNIYIAERTTDHKDTDSRYRIKWLSLEELKGSEDSGAQEIIAITEAYISKNLQEYRITEN